MTLIHRIETVMDDCPDLPLLELCRAVRSSDVSMVATLRRMVELRRKRATVPAIPQVSDSAVCNSSVNSGPNLNANLPASRRVQEAR